MFAWRGNYTGFSAGPKPDPYWTSVGYLLQNPRGYVPSFIDTSSNTHLINIIGTPQPSTLSPFTGTGGSVRFNGSNQQLTVAASNEFNLLSGGDFTIEAFVYVMGVSGGSMGVISRTSASSGYHLSITNTLQFQFGFPGTGDWTFGPTLNLNQWYHVAITRTGTTIVGYVDGIEHAISATNSTTDSNSQLSIGYYTGYFNGAISNVRLIKGTAIYNGNFTVPTSPLSNIPNCALLTTFSGYNIKNSAYMIDKSYTAGIVTLFNSPSYNGSSPYGNDYPGSIKFNGSNQYMSLPDNINYTLTDDFTMEAWIIKTATSGRRTIFAHWPGAVATNCSFLFEINASNKVQLTYGIGSLNASVAATSTTVPLNQWTHVAITRSGSSVRYFVNGVMDTTVSTVSGSFNNSTGAFIVGATNGSDGQYWGGSIRDMRLIKGEALYTSNFTVPSQPLQPANNVSFLMNGGESGYYDLSNNSLDIFLVSNGPSLFNQSKFSNYYGFKNTSIGAYLGSANNAKIQIDSSNFTIEGWGNLDGSNPGSVNAIANKGNPGWRLYVTGSNQLAFDSLGINILTSTNTITAGQWFYYTITRTGSTVRLFLNGVLESSVTNTDVYNQTLAIVLFNDSSISNGFIGTLQNFRLTKGISRYTSSFTPPNKPFSLN